jgi:NADPH-dependent 2,4-dienoyl-CoA reductase/sulfur reductase-like enzyme
MIGQEHLPQQGRLSPVVGELIGSWLGDVGIVLHGGVDVTSIKHSAGAAAVFLSDGSVVEGAHVIVATGAKTNIDLARAAGLAIEHGGVAVDPSMRTAAPGVFAVGDIAYAANNSAGRPLRVEHWDDAEHMGRIAGIGLAGGSASWSDVPGFWSLITGRELKYSAWGDGWDATHVRRSADGISVWYGLGGETVGVLTYNHDDDIEPGKAATRAHASFPPV